MISSCTRLTLALGLGILSSSLESIAQLSFEPLVISSNRLQLVLLGNPDGSYAIESSINLSNWTTLFTGLAVNGRMEYNTTLPSLSAQFFRGRPDTTMPPINITPLIETNHATETFVTMDGSETVLYAKNGTEFRLTFPSNNVATPTLFSMTLITNIPNLPFAGGLIGAVQLGPDDPDLMGAAKLTITFSTNIDRRHVASFTANADGSGIYLTPDRITGNRVTIPITHSGIFGSALATTQELNQVSLAVPPETALSLPVKKTAAPSLAQAPLSSTLLCFPGEVTEAARIRNHIRAALRRIQSKMALIIEVERQRQLVGVESDTSDIFAQAIPLACKFYEDEILPYWPETAANCPLMTVLLQFSLGIDRQFQLLGVPDEQRCTANILSPGLLCPGFKGCLNEIKLCCLSGHQGTDRIRDVVSLVRQQELLGIEGERALGCFDLQDEAVQFVIDVCTKTKWRGSVIAKEEGNDYEKIVYPTGYEELTQNMHTFFAGFAISSSEQIIEGIGLMASVDIVGPITATTLRDDYSEYDSKCGQGLNIDTTTASGDANGKYILQLSENSTNYSLTILFMGLADGQQFLYGRERNERVTTVGPTDIGCIGFEHLFSSSETDTYFAAPQLYSFSAPIGADTNTISGSTNFPGFIIGYPTRIKFQWNLHRSKVQ
jgi:hypothetical protein